MAASLTLRQSRTQATCGKLLAAAAWVFARDGFEAARIEDIAARAGYTRGAFYANFESKEDLFLALLEHWVGERIAEVKAIFSRYEGTSQRRKALREFYAERTLDRNYALLSMEFRLFAVRHPEARVRLRDRLRRLRASGRKLLEELLKNRGRALPISSHAAATGLGALSNALLIEQLVDSKAAPNAAVQWMLGLFFDALVEGRIRK